MRDISNVHMLQQKNESQLLTLSVCSTLMCGVCIRAHWRPIRLHSEFELIHDTLKRQLLQAVELIAFTTAILSAVAAGIHLISVQVVITDGHVPACAAGDQSCAEGYNVVIVL